MEVIHRNAPKFPADNINTNLAAKADVTTAGKAAENTSLIIGFATLIIPANIHKLN